MQKSRSCDTALVCHCPDTCLGSLVERITDSLDCLLELRLTAVDNLTWPRDFASLNFCTLTLDTGASSLIASPM